MYQSLSNIHRAIRYKVTLIILQVFGFIFLSGDLTDNWCYLYLTCWQIGIAIRAIKSGHLPNYGFVFASLGSTAVLLIAVRALLYAITPIDNSKKNDIYRNGSPFELFEVHNIFIFIRSFDVIFFIPSHNTEFVSSLL